MAFLNDTAKEWTHVYASGAWSLHNACLPGKKFRSVELRRWTWPTIGWWNWKLKGLRSELWISKYPLMMCVKSLMYITLVELWWWTLIHVNCFFGTSGSWETSDIYDNKYPGMMYACPYFLNYLLHISLTSRNLRKLYLIWYATLWTPNWSF